MVIVRLNTGNTGKFLNDTSKDPFLYFSIQTN